MSDPFDKPPPTVDPFDAPPVGLDPESATAAVTAQGSRGRALPNTLEAIKGSALTLRDKLLPPGNPISAITMGRYGGDDSDIAQRKADVEAYQKRLPELGVSGQVGNAIPQMAVEGAVLPFASTALRGGAQLAGLGPKMSALLGDVGTYAGFGGGKAAAEGGSATDIGKGALWGGVGGLAGHYLGAGLERGIVPKSAAAKTLLENDITPTYGQAMPWLKDVEQAGSFSPVGGSAITSALNKTVKQFSKADVNEKLRPLNLSVEGTGDEAVAAGRKLVSDEYNSRLQNVQMGGRQARQVLTDLPAALQAAHPLVNSTGAAQEVTNWANQNIGNVIGTTPITGRLWKDIYSAIGDQAANAENRYTQEAYKTLQEQWLAKLQELQPGAREAVREVDTAFRGLIPSEKARRASVDDMGAYTPSKVVRAANVAGVPETELQHAGREVLPRALANTPNNIRKALNYLGIPGAALGSGGSSLPIEAGIHALYAEPTRKLLMGQYHLPYTARQIGASVGGLSAPLAAQIYRGE